ncbi:diguanylate cyclase domain-containing protein [Terripilifer ovatus]|uniref:diguanylate cyclase domain-containing protein n=1 Tax=Terripilifer ovatus TaxID=3032367 RepID=UPI003AB97052
MSLGFVLAFSEMAWTTGNVGLGVCALMGCLSSTARIAVLVRGRAQAAAADLQAQGARSLERQFAVSYYQFAALLGLSAAYVFTLEPAPFHMLTVCLLVGYGAGVAAGVGLRPWIAIPSMITAIVPGIIAAALRSDPIYWVTAGMMTALLAGGSQSVLARSAVANLEVARRLTFEALARRDVLTTLPNRLALREWFDSHIAVADRQTTLAVHCLDLNNFKPVNDQFGHPIGDSLLRAVAARLTNALRPGDIAARLGGDEFAVIQSNSRSTGEAAGLAHRLRKEIARPYSIEGHTISISTSVGYALCPYASADMDELLRLADQALYIAKNTGSGVECNDSLMPAGRLAA